MLFPRSVVLVEFLVGKENWSRSVVRRALDPTTLPHGRCAARLLQSSVAEPGPDMRRQRPLAVHSQRLRFQHRLVL